MYLYTTKAERDQKRGKGKGDEEKPGEEVPVLHTVK